MGELSGREKVFKDPVHGYISVPVEFCSVLIDTSIFQRLRQIEQTSMRQLYPAAHHDRFIHSLGVFHLAQCVYRRLLDSCDEEDQTEIRDVLEDSMVRNTFLIASLMHDCGHAPFSHTFESFYNYSEANDTKPAYERLRECFSGDHFEISGSFKPAPHEAFSAVILKEFFSDSISKAGIDFDVEFAARMITGCTYPDPEPLKEKVYNQLIKLLNGDAIDVDKLDYILRDTWASGVSNVAIDVERLIGAMILRKIGGRIELWYHKSALSVIQSVVDARNYLYRWIYAHHTVLYYAKLLDRSLRGAAKVVYPKRPDTFWQNVFSEKPFTQAVKLRTFMSTYLPSDGDILNVLKCLARSPAPKGSALEVHKQLVDDVDELLSHAPRRIPLWKTYAEYRQVFHDRPLGDIKSASHLDELVEILPKSIADSLGGDTCAEDIIVVKAQPKMYAISEPDIHILLGKNPIPFTGILGHQVSTGPLPMHFFVFIPKEHKQKIGSLTSELQARAR